jgi:hypothetical protein
MSNCRVCGKGAVFDYPGQKTGKYCLTHKLEGMINVRIKKCIEPNCNVAAIYNHPGQKEKLYCTKHKKPDMIDIVHAKCQECAATAYFRTPGSPKATHCKTHAKEGMIDMDKRLCKELGCKIHATFGTPNTTERLYCRNHTKPGLVDNVSQKCLTEGCETQVYCHSNNNYCLACFQKVFPEKPIERNLKVKEIATVEFIKQFYQNIITDEMIKGGTSQKRPDIMKEYPNYVIICEIDENQHKKYKKDNDAARIEIIKNDLKKLTVFIRFNPDNYKDFNNKRYQSCWRVDRTDNVCKLQNAIEWESRLNKLKEVFDYYDKKPPTETTIIRLFFDGYNPNVNVNYFTTEDTFLDMNPDNIDNANTGNNDNVNTGNNDNANTGNNDNANTGDNSDIDALINKFNNL